MVVIPFQGAREECRLAYRLLPCLRPYQIKDKEVTAADTLSVVMAKGGGQAVSFIPITD